MKRNRIKLELRDAGDRSVGMFPWHEVVTISLSESLIPKHESREFEQELARLLKEYFDCECLTAHEIKEENFRLSELEKGYDG